MTISRRDFMVTASAGAGAALSSVSAAEAADPVARQAAPGENPGFHRFRFGAFDVTALSDGRRAGQSPEKTYAIDRDPKEVAALLEANMLPADRFVNSFTPVLVDTGKDVVLFDTGMGAGAREAGQGKLIAALEASGRKKEDITLVVLSHFHGDHIGGLMEDGKPAFPKARYAAGRKEFDFWTDPARLDGPTKNGAELVAKNVKPLADRMTFLDDGDEVTAGIRALAAFGHTPGHLVFRVESEGRSLMLISDTANHFVITLQRPEWHVAFDMDKDMAVQTRKRIFDMLATERLPFIGYHMPFPSLAYLAKDGEGYRYVPETYQIRET